MRAESFSSLQTFSQCKRKYYLKYIAGIKRRVDSEALRKGRRVHEGVAEKKGGEKEVDFALTKVLSGKFVAPLQIQNRKFNVHGNLKEKEGDRYIDFHEQKFAFDESFKFVDFGSPAGLFRGVIDYYYLILKPEGEGVRGFGDVFKEAHVFDWKTGKPRFERFQLNLYALFLSSMYKDTPIKCHIVNTTEEIEKVWEFTEKVKIKTVEKLTDTLRKIDEEQVFSTCSTPLCGWCDYQDICPDSKQKGDGKREKILAQKLPEILRSD